MKTPQSWCKERRNTKTLLICSLQKKEILRISAASWVQMDMLKVGALVALKTLFDSLCHENKKDTQIAVVVKKTNKST